MISISVIICTHNPRPDYLRRVLDALEAQTLPREQWELLLIDNASKEPLAKGYDLSWHPHARQIREDELGLTPARLRGIAEARGGLLVFIDDDSILAPDYLERAAAIHGFYSHIGVFGAGTLEPEFEEEPEPVVRPKLGMLALRSVPQPTWTNNVADYFCAPHGAGLCVTRRVAASYQGIVARLSVTALLDRRGKQLFCGGDDLFSWVSVSEGLGFGVFPKLRITHVIPLGRVKRRYLLNLAHDHALSHGVLRYVLFGAQQQRISPLDFVRVVLHGLKDGPFSAQYRWAEAVGTHRASQIIRQQRLRPIGFGAPSPQRPSYT